MYQAQQVLRRLVKGRLTFTPMADGHYKFCGVGTVQPLLAGVVQNLASPTGMKDFYMLVGTALKKAA